MQLLLAGRPLRLHSARGCLYAPHSIRRPRIVLRPAAVVSPNVDPDHSPRLRTQLRRN